MPTKESGALHPWIASPADALTSSRLSKLPTLLSVIAGMVDLTGFLNLGSLFTAHITGNLVVVGALLVRGGRVNPPQVLAIPVFILAVSAVWLLAKASGRRGLSLLRMLLLVQFLLLVSVLMFSAITTPSVNPHGWMAGVAAMMAVSAMACQFALLRLALPVAPSTAVMTGNLTNAVLSLLNLISGDPFATVGDRTKLRASLYLILGFFGGCVIAAVAVTYLTDYAWLFPAVLAGVAVALC